MTVWPTRVACWLPKATNSHSVYAILPAFPLQQWLYKHASVLRYTYIPCLVYSLISSSCVDIHPETLQHPYGISEHNFDTVEGKYSLRKRDRHLR